MGSAGHDARRIAVRRVPPLRRDHHGERRGCREVGAVAVPACRARRAQLLLPHNSMHVQAGGQPAPQSRDRLYVVYLDNFGPSGFVRGGCRSCPAPAWSGSSATGWLRAAATTSGSSRPAGANWSTSSTRCASTRSAVAHHGSQHTANTMMPPGLPRRRDDSSPIPGTATAGDTGHDERHARTPNQQTEPHRTTLLRRPDRAPNDADVNAPPTAAAVGLRPSPDPDASLGTSRTQRRSKQRSQTPLDRPAPSGMTCGNAQRSGRTRLSAHVR